MNAPVMRCRECRSEVIREHGSPDGEWVCQRCNVFLYDGDIVLDEAEEPQPRRSWRPVDMTAVLDGTWQPPQASVGARQDGVGMFYPGRVHGVASESEAGKTWFALHAARAELDEGNAVLFVDFEDDESGVGGRLLTLGAGRSAVADRFAYVRPEDDIRTGDNRSDLAQALGDLRPTLAILDGVTEAMTLHGLELKDNGDAARFGKLLPRWIAEQGPATVSLDHVVKSAESRGRYAIGAVHKLNGLNGAMYVLENRKPFGVGVTGRSTVYIAKDRPGQLRRHALPSREGLHWFGDLVLDSRSETDLDVRLFAPAEREDRAMRPTHVMAKVAAILAKHPGGLSKNAVETMAGGKATVVRTALELLVADGYVQVTPHGAAKVHTLVKDYEPEDQT